MIKRKHQDLKNLLDLLGHENFPGIFNQVNPHYRNRRFIFPYLSSEDTRHILAFKMMAMYGLKEKTTTEKLVKNFNKMNKRDQLFVAYNLSHELKVASIAASIAMKKQNSHIYEIGPCCGFSSLHYSHLIKEKNLNSKPISKLTVVELNKEWLEQSKEIKKMTGEYAGEIEYIHGDGINYLRNSLKKDDIIFSSIAEPFVSNGLIELSNLKPINLIVSYSEKTDDKIKEIQGRLFEESIDSNTYDIFPFEDKEYNIHIPWDIKKKGVLALNILT